MIDLFNDIVANWKTTVAGIAMLAITAAFLMGRIPEQRFMEIAMLLAGAGFLVSKDANRTGTSATSDTPAPPSPVATQAPPTGRG